MKKRWICSALALMLLLSSCGEKPPSESVTPSETPPAPTETVPVPNPTPTATPTPEPESVGALNPLTGEPIKEEYVNRRPVAIMLNNLKAALPQLGQSKADIIYEVLAEGGITRMLGVYQDVDDLGRIGSIRSSRPYYLELALGHDAIYIHAGGSEDAYDKIRQWGVTSLDGVRGSYMGRKPDSNLMWRDPERLKTYSKEHTVVTTGDAIAKRFSEYENLRRDHKEGYHYQMEFASDGTPAEGIAANVITVPFSRYKTGVFRYDADSSRYLVEEYGKPYMDGESNEQVAVTNVVVIKTACLNTGDKLGHITVDLSSGGTGYFACGGKAIDLKWSKSFPDGQLKYTDTDGNPIIFGAGSTYVNIVPVSSDLTLE